MNRLEVESRPVPARDLHVSYDKRLMVAAGRASGELGGKIAE